MDGKVKKESMFRVDKVTIVKDLVEPGGANSDSYTPDEGDVE